MPTFSVIDKHIVAGPPSNVAYNFSVTLEVLDTQEKTVLSSTSLDINAVGENDTKAYMSAVKKIQPQSPKFQDFLKDARGKIQSYYDNNYTRIIQKAKTLSGMERNAEALYHILSIPECCKGYDAAMKEALVIYQKYADIEGEKLLMKARAVWSPGDNDEAATEAAQLLVGISPSSKAYKDAGAFPLFQWARSLGEGWYIPADDELRHIALTINGGSMNYDESSIDAYSETIANIDGNDGFTKIDPVKGKIFYKMYSSTELRDGRA